MKESCDYFCPVPAEQQPLNEYEQLKESWPFRWVSLSAKAYTIKLLWVWWWGWLVAGPIAAASFPPQKYPMGFALSGSAGAGILVVLFVVRMYLGWRYIGDRLQQTTIFYEESGWYDGQVWRKPEAILTRDRLVATYQVQPFLKLLQKTGLILALLYGIDALLGTVPLITHKITLVL